LKRTLQQAGYDVTLAAGGLEAAVRFDPGSVDLLLLDLNLPNQSGWDVFGELTQRCPWVPVIIITGLPNQYRTALAAGAGALFEKPVEVPALLRTMEELLAEPREARLRRLCGHTDDTRHIPPAMARGPGRPSGACAGAPAPGASNRRRLRTKAAPP
jgi:CheY-like chemotaxis protein